MDRKAPCPCGSGRQYRNCCRPRDRALEDGAAAAVVAHQLVDGAVRVALRPVADRVACAPRCNACCHYLIRVSRVEALPIAAFLLTDAEARARFVAAYPGWRAASGPELDELEALLARHHGPPSDPDELVRWRALAAAVQLRAAACPLLAPDGNCGVYAVRPVVCRAWNVTGDAARCQPTSPAAPEVVTTPGLDDAVARARGIMVQAGAGLPSPGDAALPTQVARALADLSRSA